MIGEQPGKGQVTVSKVTRKMLVLSIISEALKSLIYFDCPLKNAILCIHAVVFPGHDIILLCILYCEHANIIILKMTKDVSWVIVTWRNFCFHSMEWMLESNGHCHSFSLKHCSCFLSIPSCFHSVCKQMRGYEYTISFYWKLKDDIWV